MAISLYGHWCYMNLVHHCTNLSHKRSNVIEGFTVQMAKISGANHGSTHEVIFTSFETG